MLGKSAQEESIIDRLDRLVDYMATELKLSAAAIYLTPQDYETFAAEHTRIYRAANGSTALLHPCSHDTVPLISEKLVEHYSKIPVRQRTGKLRSTVYASNGRGIPLGFDE